MTTIFFRFILFSSLRLIIISNYVENNIEKYGKSSPIKLEIWESLFHDYYDYYNKLCRLKIIIKRAIPIPAARITAAARSIR